MVPHLEHLKRCPECPNAKALLHGVLCPIKETVEVESCSTLVVGQRQRADLPAISTVPPSSGPSKSVRFVNALTKSQCGQPGRSARCYWNRCGAAQPLGSSKTHLDEVAVRQCAVFVGGICGGQLIVSTKQMACRWKDRVASSLWCRVRCVRRVCGWRLRHSNT